MSRTTAPLAPEHVDALAGTTPCASCTFWEVDPVLPRPGDEGVAAQKRAWVERVQCDWGPCGRVALVDDVPVGLLMWAPAAFVPGAAAFPTAPVSSDAVVLTTAYVATPHARGGLGRMLVQAMARDLVEDGRVLAVEAFGDTRGGRAGGGGARCLAPVEFLTAVGFEMQRAHPTTPRLRMDLRASVSWRDEVEAVLDRLRCVVRRPAPRPAPESARSSPPLATRTSGRGRPGPEPVRR